MKRFSLIFTLALCCSNICAQVLYVPAQVFPSIQSAIDSAGNGDTIIVSPGTYFENINFRGKSITVRSIDPNDPKIAAATVINGSRHVDPNIGSVVTFMSGEDNNSVLAGFTITGGTGSWLLVSWEFKGLRWNRCGGGILCYNMSAPTITKNVFINNITGQGGGIYIYGDPVNPHNPQDPPVHIKPLISNNTFINNKAIVNHGFNPPDTNYPNNDHGDGGAIVAFQGCDATITDNLIKDNHADGYGGGTHLRQWSNGLIEHNRVTSNYGLIGGGIHITYMSHPAVKNNLIQNNAATNLGGGGVYVYYLSQPLIEQNIIIQNTSTSGAGIGVYSNSAPIIRNNLICKNNAGAGIRAVVSSPAISHNTIADNYYGGIDCEFANPIIENNIITSNGRGWGIWVHQGSWPLIRYNNLWGNQLGTCGPDIPDQTGINGNIPINPKFVDPDSNDYHLNYNSLCINAGDPYWLQLYSTDYQGDSRLMGQYVDMGADEAQPVWNVTGTQQYEGIQQAIDDANDGDVIVVTVGAHTGQGNRDLDFRGKAIAVQSSEPNDPDIVAATIIDCNGSGSNPHRGFHFHNGEDANSVLAGLTITNGDGVYDGGAIRCWNSSSPTIRNCIITGNSSIGRGAVYCGNNSNPAIINCDITNNVATAGYGAAICCWDYSSPTILNCIITGNAAQSVGRHGGGIYCHNHSNAVVANCFISGNTAAHRGGGLAAYWSTPAVVNCTVVGNSSLEGGGISSFVESNPIVSNCIVWDNRAPEGPQIALINALRVWGVSIPTQMTVLFSDIRGGQSAACVDSACTLNWGQGNINADPNFAYPGLWDDANTPTDPNDDFFILGDFHITPASPCVDAADNSSIPASSIIDLDGEQRIFAGTIDMGADELVTNPFDLNNDGTVDYLELAVLADEWLQGGSQLQTDFHKDGFINLLDYVELANQWLWKGSWRR